jgi:ABC-2 type transport system ATP-binding protein
VAGVDVATDPRGVRARIGLAGQYAAVDGYLTGRENVEQVGRLYGLRRAEARHRAAEVLERIRLDGAADRPVRTYSGGMRRRLDLAASLVGGPRVLFLDEPTAGLDPASRRDLWELIGQLVGTGTTVLLTTQYLEEADQLADRIAVVDRGRVLSEGTAAQLKARVGGAVVQLRVLAAQRAKALAALRHLDGQLEGQHPDYERDHAAVVLPAPSGAATLRQALRLLDEAGVAIEDAALRKPTLDDVFLALTGQATTPQRPTKAA